MNTICEAIKNKRLINFTYDNQSRMVEPHLLGLDSDGDLSLRAWQIRGGTCQGWRLFHVAKLFGLTITEHTFSGSRTGYNPLDKMIPNVLCRL